jgi:myo-inositol-1(or 4)-monophosphatase
MHPYLNTAITAARRAGNMIIRSLEKLDTLEIFEKSVNDLVTRVDQTAEAIIIDVIQKAYPEHSILAEESGYHEGNELEWIIDPIDGTMNFAHGFPQFCISIALKYKDTLEHAVIFDPISQDLYTASKGSGSHLNNRRIRVSRQETLKSALIGIAFPFRSTAVGKTQDTSWQNHVNTINELTFAKLADTRKVGSAALNLAYVASGKLDGYYEPVLKAWDIAAGVLIVKEAGGLVSDFSNQPSVLESGNIIAANPKIHAELLTLLNKHQLT